MFLEGFKEAIGVAVVMVVLYLGLSSVVVIARAAAEVATTPGAVVRLDGGGVLEALGCRSGIIGAALLVFPALALGLSGFETGVVVMPLVKGDPSGRRSGAAQPDPQHEEAAGPPRR